MLYDDIRILLRERGLCGRVEPREGAIPGMLEDAACILPLGHDLGAHEVGVAELSAELASARTRITELERTIEALDQHKAHAGEVIKQLGIDKDGAYRERNRLVAALARIAMTRASGVLTDHPAWKAQLVDTLGAHNWTSQWRAGLGRHPESDETWDREWMTIVFIDTPAGQLSWHVHDSELALFQGLPEYKTGWDGHDTPEKYRRLELVR